MNECTYDNPYTMTREYWIEGKIICEVSAELLFSKMNLSENINKLLVLMKMSGEFKDKKIVGDISGKYCSRYYPQWIYIDMCMEKLVWGR